MKIEKIIQQLLYRYDCVIIPNFGGFITQDVNAKFFPLDYTFTPPKKTIGFNIDLNHSDGLLINAVSDRLNISFKDAAERVDNQVREWLSILDQENTLTINHLGSFKKNNNHIEFTPLEDINFNINTFGLSNIQVKYIKKDTKNKPSISSFAWKPYAAAVAFALMVGISGFFANDTFIQPQLSSFIPLLNGTNPTVLEEHHQIIAPAIEAETSNKVDSNVVEKTERMEPKEGENTLTPNERVEEDRDLSIKAFQVIGGSFKVYAKAMEHQAYLKRTGFERAVIVGKVGNYFMVAIDTFNDSEDAYKLKKDLEKQGIDVFVRY